MQFSISTWFPDLFRLSRCSKPAPCKLFLKLVVWRNIKHFLITFPSGQAWEIFQGEPCLFERYWTWLKLEILILFKCNRKRTRTCYTKFAICLRTFVSEELKLNDLFYTLPCDIRMNVYLSRADNKINNSKLTIELDTLYLLKW